jgi:glycosyltransferase involved in cell wall biosynthesis
MMPSVEDKVNTIINFTDTEQFARTELPKDEIVRIGIFCRLEKQKNFIGFVEMLNKLRELTDVKFHVEWYGNHDFLSGEQKEYFEEGMRIIKQNKLEALITIYPPTKNVPKLIPTYHVMCLPSLFEGFSNSISEYICCGRPVICSDVSDNSIMVHDGENGFLFNPRDVTEMTSAFLKFFGVTVKEREKMGGRSREIAEKLFDKNNFINSYTRLIEA